MLNQKKDILYKEGFVDNGDNVFEINDKVEDVNDKFEKSIEEDDIEGIEIDLEMEDFNDFVEIDMENEEYQEGNIPEENLYLTTEEKELLAEKDEKLVQYMAKKFINTGIDEDELVGIAYEGYVKALNMYKKNKKTKFSTYACKCMGNEILCYLRKEKKWTDNTTSMYAPIGVDKNGNSLDLEKVLKEESGKALDEMVISKDIDALVIESLKVLNETEQKITKYRFGICGVEEKTQKAIAKELGISQAYVSKLEKDCLLKIKKYMQEEDLKNGILGKNSYFNY